MLKDLCEHHNVPTISLNVKAKGKSEFIPFKTKIVNGELINAYNAPHIIVGIKNQNSVIVFSDRDLESIMLHKFSHYHVFIAFVRKWKADDNDWLITKVDDFLRFRKNFNKSKRHNQDFMSILIRVIKWHCGNLNNYDWASEDVNVRRYIYEHYSIGECTDIILVDAFNRLCETWGLKKSDQGKLFKHNGEKYIVFGFDVKKFTKPITCISLGDGTFTNFDSDIVKESLL